MKSSSADDHRWRFVTNHANVLERIYSDPDVRVRDIAVSVGITERAVAQIVKDLEEAGYLTKTSDGISGRRPPRRTTSTRPSTRTAAAVLVVPRSTPRL